MDGNLQDSLTSLVSQFEKGAAKYAHIMTGVDTDLAFDSSTWYGKILSIPVDDAVREWRSWMASAQEVEDLERAEAELQYRAVIREAMLIARHRGGGVIIPMGLPGSPSSKLNVDQIKRGSITRLVNLTRDQIIPGPVDRDPLSETFCMPEYWTINQVRFHPSRVILVNGRRAPGSSLLASEIWGNSIWVHLREAIESADSLPSQLSSLLDEAKLDVVTIPDLAALLSTKEGENALLRRWTAVARLKQIGNISLIDGGPVKEGTKTEGWDQKQLTWSGLSDVAKTVLLLMAGASDIPMTRLSGEQQSGLSGADAGSLRNYYDAVSSTQKLILQPQIAPLDEMLIRNALGKRPETVWYRWNTLFQVDDLTAAQVDKLMAETSALYASNALVPTEALEKATHNRMIETDRWPGLEKALEEVPEAERYGQNGEGETDPTIGETHSERLETQSMDQGPIVLGPEIFQEVKEDGAESIEEV